MSSSHGQLPLTEDEFKKEIKTLKDVNVQENQHREQKKMEYKKL